jgi:hypothetical protein
MKKFSFFLSIFIAIFFLLSTVFAGDVWVNGYYRSDGTYVRGHYRSAPDGNSWNNYSTKGNTNPYTGKRGYVDPYRSYSPNPHKYNDPYKSKTYNLWNDD